MGEVKWTKEQQQAIQEKNCNLLVAAAAGSGKTAVLVERIIHKIVEEKLDLDQLLVVTFTNAAASEMRQRILDAIYQKLEEHPEDEHMQNQTILIAKSHICTIHSFCLEVIRNHFYEVGLSPNFRIGEQTEMEILKQEVLEDLFEEKYEQGNEAFLKLLDTYTSYQGDEPLKEMLLKLYRAIQSSPFPEEWLEKAVEEFNISDVGQEFSKTKWGKVVLASLKGEIEACIAQLQYTKQQTSHNPELEKFSKVLQRDQAKLEEILVHLDFWDKTYQLIQELQFEKWPVDKKVTLEQKEIAKKQRDEVKKRWNKQKDKILYDSKQANEDIKQMYETLYQLKELLLEFKQRFAQKKKEKNVIDFNDIEHFALQILIQKQEGKELPTQIAKEYRDQFKEIAIDEYQDSNLVQESILTIISKGNNLFMVGDVKQSIYRFRQARPELFLEKYETYVKKEKQEEGQSLKIQLFKNFRSRKNILQVTNMIFEAIMSEKVGEIEYTQEEYLNLGANYPKEEENLCAGKTEIHVIDLQEEETQQEEEETQRIEDVVLEAKWVTNKIEELLKNGGKVYDKKMGYRSIQPKDIVILLRSTSVLAPIYERELNAKQIPVFSDSSSQYFDTIEIQTILALLKIMDNPLQDIPLVTVLRSELGGFDDNELMEIKINSGKKKQLFYETMLEAKEKVNGKLKEKIQEFFQKIEEWRQEQEYIPLEEFLWKIYLETGYYHYVGLMPNGAVRQANLKLLLEKAKQYEKTSLKGIFYFIHFMERLKKHNSDMDSAKLIGENENVVRIMSIHKSKGLEFPVVILASCGKKFNFQDLNEKVLIHQDMGIGPKYVNYERKIEYNTIAKEAIMEVAKIETLSEEMRILYVALTRAKEKLILSGLAKDSVAQLEEKEKLLSMYPEEKIHPNVVKQYKSYLDWLELVYLKKKEEAKESMELYIHSKQEIQKELPQEEVLQKKEEILQNLEKQINEVGKVPESILQDLQWEYPNRLASLIGSKTSVTAIEEEKEKWKMLKEETKERKSGKKIGKERKVPQFLSGETKITPTRKGTLMHLCMQVMQEKEVYTKEKIENLVQKLVQDEKITWQEAKAIDVQKLLEYTQSDLWQELKQAKEIKKEQPFYFYMDAKEIYEEEISQKILVQGMMDLVYRDKQNYLILVDYKTDYVKEEQELVKKYTNQLQLYKRALEEATNEKVKKVIIYSVCLNKSIVIEEN